MVVYIFDFDSKSAGSLLHGGAEVFYFNDQWIFTSSLSAIEKYYFKYSILLYNAK